MPRNRRRRIPAARLQDGAAVYVRSDACRMAGDVDQTLLQIIAGHGLWSADATENYVQVLKDHQRYQRDVY